MTPENSSPTFGQRVLSLIRFFVRLLFTLILAVGLGAAVYYLAAYGLPALREQYIQPVEDNTQRLDELEAQQRQNLTALTQQIERLHTRVTELEVQNDNAKIQLHQLENELEAAQSRQATQAATLTAMAAQPAALANTQAELTAQSEALATLSDRIAALNSQLDEVMTANDSSQALLSEIQTELYRLQLMELLTRSRLFVSQGNFAQAEASIQVALDVADLLSETAPAYQRPSLNQGRDLLQGALEQLAVSPLLAADQLDGAWQLIQGGLPPKPSPTPAAESTPEAAATPTPGPTSTPTSEN